MSGAYTGIHPMMIGGVPVCVGVLVAHATAGEGAGR